MRIKILILASGYLRETGYPVVYTPGDVIEVDDFTGTDLCQAGIAEITTDDITGESETVRGPLLVHGINYYNKGGLVDYI
jgi:hypothetical protein